MPYHEVPKDEAVAERIAEIQMTERIVSVTPAGDGALIVITEAKVPLARRDAEQPETRDGGVRIVPGSLG